MRKLAFLFIVSLLAASTSFAQTVAAKPAAAAAVQPAPAKKGKLPLIAFTDLKHEFGTVKEGDLASYEFVFKNTGKAPLILTSVSASCGCTTPEWPREPIAPGKTGKVKAIYNSKGRPGAFTKQITVVSNASTEPTILTIGGNVEKVESGVPEVVPTPGSPIKQ